MRVFVFDVDGYAEPWFIVTSALDLSAAQVLEAYAARFRQENAIRDHKQRLGMQEVRAWTIRAGSTAPQAAPCWSGASPRADSCFPWAALPRGCTVPA